MTRLGLAVLIALALLAAPVPVPAQEAGSRAAVGVLAKLLEQAKLESFAVRESPDADVYVSVMYVPGAQLLVVRGRHPVPSALDARIAAKDFRGAYGDHNGSTLREGKLFVMDMNADGLVVRPGRGTAFDIVYEDGERETRLDGDWRRQKISEKEYHRRAADLEKRYSGMLQTLIDALRKLEP